MNENHLELLLTKEKELAALRDKEAKLRKWIDDACYAMGKVAPDAERFHTLLKQLYEIDGAE